MFVVTNGYVITVDYYKETNRQNIFGPNFRY